MCYRLLDLEFVSEESSQRSAGLSDMSGVKQPIIARMEKGTTKPQLDTVLKVLASLGMTLAVVPMESK